MVRQEEMFGLNHLIGVQDGRSHPDAAGDGGGQVEHGLLLGVPMFSGLDAISRSRI